MHPSKFSGSFPRPDASSLPDAPPTGADAGANDGARAEAAAPTQPARPPLDVTEVRESPRFDLSTPESCASMAQYLDEHGYCVVGGVLDPEEIKKGTALAWDWLETNPPGTTLKRDDIATWHKEWLPDPLNGIMAGFGFNQSDFLWLLRTRTKVRQAFETVWNSSDLLVSYDGGNMFRPHAHPSGDPEWRTSGGWWHVDQNAHKPGHAEKCCVQGVVLLTDADAGSGGLCVIPGSHNEFVNMCERNAMAKANKGVDYVPVPYDDPVLSQEEGWSPVLVGAKAGDMILWDSRCVHCNTPGFATPVIGVDASKDQAASAEVEGGAGGEGSAEAEEDGGPGLLRLAGYVCMTPASWATKEAIDERVFSFEHRHGSSHWPHCFRRAGAAPPYAEQAVLADAPPEVQQLVHGGRHREDDARGKCAVS
mmetsp:Transcript_17436/g.40927  ORF Transcript_17436/g.40927 Transcript_17436/m.40927 type:complete len:422 (-) Transcript_17436:42-1307(-)